MRHILIPLDSSDFSREALISVRKLFDPKTHHISLLHVASLPAGYTTPMPALMLDAWLMDGIDRVDEAVEDYAKRSLEKFKASLLHELEPDIASLKDSGFQVALALEFGDPAQQIIHFVQTHTVDLVVMATHGRKGLSRGLLGSVAESVVRGVHLPVLLVRPEASAT